MLISMFASVPVSLNATHPSLQMVDAAYEAYNRHSQGYAHFSGGAFCSPGDYHGLVALLVRADVEPLRDEQHLREALDFLLSNA